MSRMLMVRADTSVLFVVWEMTCRQAKQSGEARSLFQATAFTNPERAPMRRWMMMSGDLWQFGGPRAKTHLVTCK